MKLANMEHLSNEAVKFENATLVMLEIKKIINVGYVMLGIVKF